VLSLTKYRHIGRHVPRIDGPEKATGKAVFTVDVELPNMVYGKILRSPYPHARIKGIDASEALATPGVLYVLTGAEIPHIRYAFVDTPRYPADQQPLAVDKVRYAGDEVAAVVAETEQLAEEVLEKIRVEYELLPGVFTSQEALKPDAPIIHETSYHSGNTAWEKWGVKGKWPLEGNGQAAANSNISAETKVSSGDVQAGLAQADLVRTDTFSCKATAHCAMEPHAAVAAYDPDTGKLDLYLSTMGIFYKRFILSQVLKMPLNKVRVRHSYVGGAFGGKIDVFPYEFCAAYLSRKLCRPVKFELSREEVFSTTRQRHPIDVTITTGLKKDGTITAQDIKVLADNGGYRGSGPIVSYLCHGFSFPVYKVDNYRYHAIATYTNNPVRGPQRGHGAPQIRFAIDSQLDMLARELGLDTTEVMLKNVRQKGDTLPNGDYLGSCGLTESILGAKEKVGWTEIRGRSLSQGNGRKRRGVGISLCAMFSGAMYYPFTSAAVIKIHDDGSATLFTGTQELGQGAYTTLAQVAAEVLNLEMDQVSVVAGDTETCPVDLGSYLSGGALVTGNAVKLAAEDARRQILCWAGQKLGVEPEKLALQDKMVQVIGTDQELPVAVVTNYAILHNNGQPIEGRGSYKGYPETDRYPSLAKGKGLFTGAYGFAAQAVEVEVDTLTGEVKLLKASTHHDCGYPLNENIVAGQVEGCASMGQGQALCEEVILEQGLMLNANFLDYKLPLAPDTPICAHQPVNTVEPRGPFGAKEVGEGSVAGMLAAVANAVYDAAGVRITSLPITPDKVLAALQKQQKEQVTR
jgi:4-hydroxybenzoyl-CoA reductase subunit alpha